ncbi:hypothetical protein GRFL_0985 [Christiangramia flava JLT2011]|uniref:Secreted protein n=1 Tax=Christiangramia flava JLT2011 TaxID=1229726 RepID=A0A1L7I275_9FLAO|nr:hypothetical protein GRFL_0985 [Christiangramia flava JLT2011]
MIMALLVLFSTFSFTVDKHYCGSYLVDSAVFSKAVSCGMDMGSSMDDKMSEDHCCSNKKVSVDGQDELKLSFDQLQLHQQMIFTAFTYVYFDLFEPKPEQVIPFKDYSPPLLVSDIHIVDQVFLI